MLRFSIVPPSTVTREDALALISFTTPALPVGLMTRMPVRSNSPVPLLSPLTYSGRLNSSKLPVRVSLQWSFTVMSSPVRYLPFRFSVIFRLPQISWALESVSRVIVTASDIFRGAASIAASKLSWYEMLLPT